MKSIVVLYHSHCLDGFSGAWAAWKKFGSRADYIPIKHQFPPPKGLRGKEVYLVDIIYPLPVFRKLVKANKRVVVIDHHKTAQPIAPLAHEHVLDMNHSGAVLAWKYFHPKARVPKLLKVVERIDLFKMNQTLRHLLADLERYDFNFRTWEKLAKDFESNARRKKHGQRGAIIFEYKERLVNELLAQAEDAKFEGHRAAVVNSPEFESEIGNRLVEKGYPIAIIWRRIEGRIKVSLRSVKGVNVSHLAERYGGGGHPQAAGFKIPDQQPYPWKYR